MGGARRPLLFAAVGVANTAVDFGVFLTLTRLLGADPVASSAAGFLAGAAHSYVANGLLTFGDRGARLASPARALRFAAATAACLGVSALAMAAALTVLPDVAAKAASVLATFGAGYWLNHRFVFGPDRTAGDRTGAGGPGQTPLTVPGGADRRG